MCRMCLVLKDVGSCDINSVMTVQTPDPPPRAPARHRLSLMTRGLCVNLRPCQIMSTFLALQRKTTKEVAGERKSIGVFNIFLCLLRKKAAADSSGPPRASAPDVFGTCSRLPTLKRRRVGGQDSAACPGRHRCTRGHTDRQLCRHTHTHRFQVN